MTLEVVEKGKVGGRFEVGKLSHMLLTCAM